jgi:hypothetical protein
MKTAVCIPLLKLLEYFNYNWQNASDGGVGTTCVSTYFQVYQDGGFDMETALVIISSVILIILYCGKNL